MKMNSFVGFINQEILFYAWLSATVIYNQQRIVV